MVKVVCDAQYFHLKDIKTLLCYSLCVVVTVPVCSSQCTSLLW